MADLTPRMSAADYLRMVGAGRGRAAGGFVAQSKDAPACAPRRRRKFGNERVGRYDSKHEARYAGHLEMMRLAKEPAERVVDVKHHVRFEVIPKQDGERASFYEADFVVTYADGRQEVVDAKSEITRKDPKYVLKRKLMLQVHGIRIKEV